MKYFLLVCCVFFASCFGIGDDSVSSTGLREIKTDNFSLQAPENWRSLERSEFPDPKTGKVVLAIASNSKKDNYINNLLILEIENTLGESSLGLMENTKVGLKAGLSSFSLLGENDINFADGDLGKIMSYAARYSANTPEVFYIQTAKSCDNVSYFLTISLAEKLETYERYEYLLSTFECR